MNQHWQAQKERGSHWGMRFVVAVFKLLGERACKVVLWPILAYFYLSSRSTRQALRRYYQQLHTVDAGITARPFVHMVHFGFGIVERMALWTGRFDEKRLQRHQAEVLYEHAASGQGGVIFTAHLGNFELCRAAGRAHLPAKINVIVDYANAEKINAVMAAVNADFGVDLIAVEHIDMVLAMRLKDKIDNGEFVVIAADRVNANSAAHQLSLPFLGAPAAFPTGPYLLAHALGCPVFSLYAFRIGGGRYAVYFEKLFDRVSLPRKNRENALQSYAQLYLQQLTHYCQRYPTQWFNFYDFWQATVPKNMTESMTENTNTTDTKTNDKS